MKLEVLMSIMNIKNEEQLKNKINQNNITTDVLVINQVENNEDIFEFENIRCFSMNEKGASKSRNNLMRLAKGDICIFADDDMIYDKNYENTITKAFEKNPDADIILFYIGNYNENREKHKHIGNKKINILDIMRARTSEIAFRKSFIEKYNIKFDENFGPPNKFKKGEDTIFLADCLKNKVKIYSVDEKIGSVKNETSTWFTGYNEEFLFCQDALFYRIYGIFSKLIFLQFVIRKYGLYKKNLSIFAAYKQMVLGAKMVKKKEG